MGSYSQDSASLIKNGKEDKVPGDQVINREISKTDSNAYKQ